MGYDNNKRPVNNGNQKFNSYNKFSGQNKSYNAHKKDSFNKPHQKNDGYVKRTDKPKFNQEFKSKEGKQNNIYKNSNNFVFKSDDDIYAPKVYAKKPKEKTFYDDIIIPEYLEDKQRMRNKRANDKKYKNRRNH